MNLEFSIKEENLNNSTSMIQLEYLVAFFASQNHKRSLMIYDRRNRIHLSGSFDVLSERYNVCKLLPLKYSKIKQQKLLRIDPRMHLQAAGRYRLGEVSSSKQISVTVHWVELIDFGIIHFSFGQFRPAASAGI